MKNFKFEQIKPLFLLSFLIITIHFIIMYSGDYPGGNYGMAPFLLIIGLPILIFFWVIILFTLNFFKLELKEIFVSILYILSYFIVIYFDSADLSDPKFVNLFVYPPIISLIVFLVAYYLIGKKD